MQIPVKLGKNTYTVTVQRGTLSQIGTIYNLNRRVLVVTDSGVPAQYAETVASQCKAPTVVTVPQGEGSKSMAVLETLCREMLVNGFTRTDCVVAVGGGVVGDLAGFAAASYMRGIDFYNVPTTTLSQVDSSIGGKVAINMAGIKNCVGAFYQPRGVLVDPDVLSTLPARQVANGLAEAVKMAVTFDKNLFSVFENTDPLEHLDDIIAAALRIKADVVRQDEKEKGLRRVLNFGHTIGHGIESAGHLQDLYHGECVALGMLPMCAPAVRERLMAVLQKLQLPTTHTVNRDAVWAALSHDKKLDGDTLTVILCDQIGTFTMQSLPLQDFKDKVYGKDGDAV